jgi:phage gpG-like protein
MTMPIDPFTGPSPEEFMESASRVKFGISFSGTSAADLLLGRIVQEPRMWADPQFSGASFNTQAKILAHDVDKLAMDIRSFRVPLRRAVEQVMIPSIRTNFDVGGRPRWQPLAQGTVDNRHGSAEPILIRTGRLKRTATQKNMWKYYTTSIGSSVSAVEFDEDQLKRRVPYGIFHQYGAVGWRNAVDRMVLQAGGIPGPPSWELPSRMFVTMRPEDQVEIHSIFYAWLVERADYHFYGFGNRPGRR